MIFPHPDSLKDSSTCSCNVSSSPTSITITENIGEYDYNKIEKIIINGVEYEKSKYQPKRNRGEELSEEIVVSYVNCLCFNLPDKKHAISITSVIPHSQTKEVRKILSQWINRELKLVAEYIRNNHTTPCNNVYLQGINDAADMVEFGWKH